LLRFYGIVLAFCFFAATTSAQENFTRIGSVGDEFTFICIRFDAMGQGWDNGGWAHDYPDAEINFLPGVTRLSGIHINAEPAVLRLDDDRVFLIPFFILGRNWSRRWSEFFRKGG
jgi:hypothetical protein